MKEKIYSLIIAAVPPKEGDYYAGWKAGDVLAHLDECKLNGKVFWFCPVQFVKGVDDSDREIFKKMINKILDGKMSVGDSCNGLKLNLYGCIYEAGAISWRFKLDRIFRGNHFNENLKDKEIYGRYFGFRKVYLEYTEEDNKRCYWFLISDIQKINNPIKKRKIGDGIYELPGFKCKYGQLLTNYLGYPVFVHTIPRSLYGKP